MASGEAPCAARRIACSIASAASSTPTTVAFAPGPLASRTKTPSLESAAAVEVAPASTPTAITASRLPRRELPRACARATHQDRAARALPADAVRAHRSRWEFPLDGHVPVRIPKVQRPRLLSHPG